MIRLPAGTCTDAERLAQYADGRLEHPDCAEVETHLERCSACRDVLMAVTAFAQRERGRISSSAVDSHRYEEAIASLAPGERTVLLARYEHVLGFEEIARTLGMDTHGARALFASAVMKLRVRLARH